MTEIYLRLLDLGADQDDSKKWERVLASKNYSEAISVARENRFGASHLDKKVFALFKGLVSRGEIDSSELTPLLNEYIDSELALSLFHDYLEDPFKKFGADYAETMPDDYLESFLNDAREFMFRKVSRYVLD